MANKFLKSLSSFGKTLILVAICLLLSLLIVWPLWKFATSASKAYTLFVFALLALYIVISIILKVKRHAKK